ncbi:MAG: hypothetical protein SGPRY_009250 [Prymnesium sp.]
MISEQMLLSSPSARELLAAGVPRDEVLAGLRAQAASVAGTPSHAYTTPSDELAPQVVRRPSARVEEPLPPGWEQRFDPASGRKFYIDFNTQTTSWTRPTVVGQTPRQAVSHEPAGLPSSWQLESQTNQLPSISPASTSTPQEPLSNSTLDQGDGARGSSKKQAGFLSGLFGRSKGHAPSQEDSPPVQYAAAPSPEAAVPTQQKGLSEQLQGALSQLCDTSSPLHVRLQAEQIFNKLAVRLRQSALDGPLPPAEEVALHSINDGETALKLLDVLGSTSIPTIQAPITCCFYTSLCRSLCRLAELNDVKNALLNAGALLFVSALLGAPADDVKQEASLLLLTMCETSAACGMLVSAEAVSPLLALLAAGSSLLKLSALELLERLCKHGYAQAVASAGGATPLAFELVRAAGIAKGWSGGSAEQSADGERMAKQESSRNLRTPGH